MRPIAGHRAGQHVARDYASAVEDVGRALLPTLRRLELAAADPSSLADRTDELPQLQYALHVAAERVLGLAPGGALETVHDELATALAIAREETALVAEALDDGHETAAGLVWEWRVAVFGVRLSLRQLDDQLSGAPAAPGADVGWASGWGAVVLLLLGVAGVLGGALAGAWPVWLAGLALVAVSTGVSRRP